MNNMEEEPHLENNKDWKAPKTGEKKYVGVKVDKSGNKDYSHAAEYYGDKNEWVEKYLGKEKLDKIYYTLINTGNDSEFCRENKRYARENNIPYDEFRLAIKKYAKEKIDFPEKTYHFHATGFDAFEKILKNGELLSRNEMRKRGIDNKFGYSASNKIMMTRDIFDKYGKIIKPGISAHGVGNTQSGVTFIFNPEIMDLENYDAIGAGKYPTTENIRLDKKYCNLLLVENLQDKEKVTNMLNQYGFDNINVKLKDKWIKNNYEK